MVLALRNPGYPSVHVYKGKYVVNSAVERRTTNPLSGISISEAKAAGEYIKTGCIMYAADRCCMSGSIDVRRTTSQQHGMSIVTCFRWSPSRAQQHDYRDIQSADNMALLIDCAQFCRCNGYLQTASNTASETTLAGDEAVIATKAILTVAAEAT